VYNYRQIEEIKTDTGPAPQRRRKGNEMFRTDLLYMNIETGELLTYAEMIHEAEEMYDFDDWTNALELWDYYELSDIPASAK
jgi:hypothetical protein